MRPVAIEHRVRAVPILSQCLGYLVVCAFRSGGNKKNVIA
jgi:hypothetical protein